DAARGEIVEAFGDPREPPLGQRNHTHGRNVQLVKPFPLDVMAEPRLYGHRGHARERQPEGDRCSLPELRRNHGPLFPRSQRSAPRPAACSAAKPSLRCRPAMLSTWLTPGRHRAVARREWSPPGVTKLLTGVKGRLRENVFSDK